MEPTFNLTFNPETFYEQLNSVLFESPILAEAMTKLRLVQQQAEDLDPMAAGKIAAAAQGARAGKPLRHHHLG